MNREVGGAGLTLAQRSRMGEVDSEAQAPVRAGDVLAGKYEVTRVLGVGGMGVVVAARHVQLKGQVAIKFLLPEVAKNPEVVARFLREAQAATRIGSEHVTRVLDVGTLDGGAPYMIMEFLEGQDLGQKLAAEGPLAVDRAVDFVLQAMEALAEAHAAGIVHRDLKPSNLFLSHRADGSPLVKVLDFGISKATTTDASDSQLTRTQGFMGSPLYMSPEQIRSSKHVDARSDVWSLGVILYELLSGRLPFGGDTASAILASIIADPHVPLEHACASLPPQLCRVVDRCLAKSPDGRYPTVAELANDLAAFGSRDAELSRTRITGVVHRGRLPSLVESAPGQPAPAAQPAVTAVAWGATEAPKPRRTWLVLGAAGGGVALVSAIAVGIFVLKSPADEKAQPSADVATAASLPAPSTLAPAAPSVAAVHAAPAPAPSSSASADAGAPTRQAAPRPAAKPVAAKPAAAPKSTNGNKLDGLIEDRR